MINIEFPKRMAVEIPTEDFLSYDTKFTSCSGEDWLLLCSIVFVRKGLQGHYKEVIA